MAERTDVLASMRYVRRICWTKIIPLIGASFVHTSVRSVFFYFKWCVCRTVNTADLGFARWSLLKSNIYSNFGMPGHAHTELNRPFEYNTLRCDKFGNVYICISVHLMQLTVTITRLATPAFFVLEYQIRMDCFRFCFILSQMQTCTREQWGDAED